jgi:hypothetical protein
MQTLKVLYKDVWHHVVQSLRWIRSYLKNLEDWRCVYPDKRQTRRQRRDQAYVCRDLWAEK